jgi:hypothetical protein
VGDATFQVDLLDLHRHRRIIGDPRKHTVYADDQGHWGLDVVKVWWASERELVIDFSPDAYRSVYHIDTNWEDVRITLEARPPDRKSRHVPRNAVAEALAR